MNMWNTSNMYVQKILSGIDILFNFTLSAFSIIIFFNFVTYVYVVLFICFYKQDQQVVIQ